MEKNNSIFIETGTHNCKNAESKTDTYDKVYTIDITKDRSDNCNDLVDAYTGTSPEVLKDLLQDINKPVDFYLDAHADIIPGTPQDKYDLGAKGSSIRENSQISDLMPLMDELGVIREHNKRVGGNYVCIDDLRCWDRGASTHTAKCSASKLWRDAGISTDAILDNVGDQLKEHNIIGDRLCIKLV